MRRFLLIAYAAIGLVGIASAQSLPPVGPKDLVEGPANAPVTVIEYFSLDCPHCARWEKDVYPRVKTDFIDTGKVRFVQRDFPLHAGALKAALLAHCDPSEYSAFVDTLFESQQIWALLPDPEPELAKIAKLGGITDAKFKSCLEDKALSGEIVASRAGGEAAGVTGTPYFFFNGKGGHSGELTYDDFAKSVHDAGA